jgi:hypothetical protein
VNVIKDKFGDITLQTSNTLIRKIVINWGIIFIFVVSCIFVSFAFFYEYTERIELPANIDNSKNSLIFYAENKNSEEWFVKAGDTIKAGQIIALKRIKSGNNFLILCNILNVTRILTDISVKDLKECKVSQMSGLSNNQSFSNPKSIASVILILQRLIELIEKSYLLRSPITGIVHLTNSSNGSKNNMESIIVTPINRCSLGIILSFNSNDIGKIHKGQYVSLKYFNFSGDKEETIEGTISKIEMTNLGQCKIEVNIDKGTTEQKRDFIDTNIKLTLTYKQKISVKIIEKLRKLYSNN